MKEIHFVLVTDGPSDKALLRILRWLLGQLAPDVPVTGQHADFRGLARPPGKLSARIAFALEAFPSDLLFIHRDAEGDDPAQRRAEIGKAIDRLPERLRRSFKAHVAVIPVRMTEAWLLFDESALRKAASNPNGKVHLTLPRIAEVESLSDPKQRLRGLLIEASELSGRRRKNFHEVQATYRLADLLDDFTPLRNLPAFRALESDLERVLPAVLGSTDRPDG